MKKQKRLLLLGGSRYILPLIEAAHKMNLYVITCDYLPDNIAHKYSDEYCNVSIIDKDAVLSAAKKLDIDGILSFACDPGVVTAAYVAEKLHLPSCGSYESVSILQNKGRFREFLTKHHFNVPMAKSYHVIKEALEDISNYHWPVIVKPTDSAGSKGVIRVDRPEDLEHSIRYALSFSHSNEFIIEEFIQKKGFSSDSEGFSVKGELKFVSFSSQRFDETSQTPYVPSAFSWPSSISKEHQKELSSEIQRLLTLLGMDTSVYNIETREGTDGKAYIMEVSPRGGGNRLAEMVRYGTGVDLITNSIKAAIGEPVSEIKQKEFDGFWAEIILHSQKSGKFDSLWISDEIKDCVIEEDLWISSGTPVHNFSAANEAIGTLVLKFKTKEFLNKIMSEQENHIKVIVK